MLAVTMAVTMIVALVTQDQVPLRAAPRDSAPRQVELTRGDWLEVRGERLGFVQVWDHRHERAGYVRRDRVRTYPLDEASAPALHAVVEFVQGTPGQESLGIGAAALFLRAAAPTTVGTDTWDAIGTMADRLAARASARRAQAGDALAAHLAVAESYGIHMVTVETEAEMRLCYDGEAFRRVLALGGKPDERARAALALTSPGCVSPGLGPVETQAVDEGRRSVVASVDAARLPAWIGARLRLRRAEIEAALAYAFSRRGEATRAKEAAGEALGQLALVARIDLADDDLPSYDRAALRVAAARWAAEPAGAPTGTLRLEARPGGPGETCLRIVDTASPRTAPAERCTYGLVWTASVRVSPRGRVLSVAVQPLSGWVELWFFRRVDAGWVVDTLLPAAAEPDLGYVELAGWSPDGERVLLSREAWVGGALRRSFEVLRVSTLTVELQARSLDHFATFKKWHSPDWKGHTLALR
jgi:hypothetical protein